MWRKPLLIIAILLLVTGIGFLLFPPLSNLIGQTRANSVIDTYENNLDHIIGENDDSGITADNYEDALKNGEIDEAGHVIYADGSTSTYTVTFKADLDRLYRDSKAYNASIFHHQGTVDTINYEDAALNMSSYGLDNQYGYLSAPKIGLSLPVYLGANDYMMSFGAAHLNGTSLPLNDTDTNVAIAGHTGYIGRIFFDNIQGLDIGDSVSFTNYWETIPYEVVDYKIVVPTDTEDLYIKDGRQLLTMITCIPDGYGDFDRYLVICERK